MVAGLWECWEKGDTPLCSFSVLTHPNTAIPPPLVADGPIFLPSDSWRRWLDPDSCFPKRFLLDSAQPALEAYPVSRAIHDLQRDDYTLLEPADAMAWEEDSVASKDDFDDEDSRFFLAWRQHPAEFAQEAVPKSDVNGSTTSETGEVVRSPDRSTTRTAQTVDATKRSRNSFFIFALNQ